MMGFATTAPITVVIPVGPKPHHREYLGEMLASIEQQSYLPSEIILVNDGGPSMDLVTWIFGSLAGRVLIREYIQPWNVGMVACWNCGVGLARNELVLLVGADDRLYGDCIDECYKAWQREQEPLGYYYLGVKYSDGREQNTACNAAMVTKALWKHTGGFPPQSAVGAPDHIFLSMLLAASNKGLTTAKILRVCDDMLYWYRVGENTETTKNIWPAIEAVKDYVHTYWVPQD
jgi:glycosyltransferase involved in cell wall biosynthesis